MDVTLLRTLTEKSFLKFGKHFDMKVGDFLGANKTRYLRWVYYNCSKITFIDEILNKIRIKEKDRIEKPGKQPDKFYPLIDKLHKKTDFYIRSHQKRVDKFQRKAMKRQQMMRDRIINNKSRLQRLNQGHQQ